jgi:diguanylate cyclase (GGDEF)-like protein
MTEPLLARARLTPITPWPAAGSLDAHIRAEEVRVVFQQAPPAQLISVVAAGVICYALWGVAGHARLLLWMGAIAVSVVGRISLSLAFRRRAPTVEQMPAWETAFVLSLAVVSLVWGLGGWFVMPRDSLIHQAIVYFYLMGVAGGAVATYSAHALASAVAICALMLPVTIAFALQNVLELRVLAAGGVLYLAAALRSTRSFGFFLRQTFQLSYELNQAYGRARELSRTDDLTGLANRRAFVDLGTTALDQARRYDRALSLVMFDIDHFKQINDSNGHAAGDAVLRAVAGAVKQAARAADTPGRLGGEEFALLLPETGAAAATGLAERLRRDVAALAIPFNGTVLRCTCSFGVAERDQAVLDLDALLGRADAALYLAKAQGRNRVYPSAAP